MTDSRTLALGDVCPPMAALVSDKGWDIIRSEGINGYNTTATIEKNGVILRYDYSKGDEDYYVFLKSKPHPSLSLELYRAPSLPAVLHAVGVHFDRDDIFNTAASHLPQIEAYLADKQVWEQQVRDGAVKLLSQYNKWRTGPNTTQDLANSLLGRHRWLSTGIVPSLNDLVHPPAEPTRHLRRALLIAIVGISVVFARYLT